MHRVLHSLAGISRDPPHGCSAPDVPAGVLAVSGAVLDPVLRSASRVGPRRGVLERTDSARRAGGPSAVRPGASSRWRVGEAGDRVTGRIAAVRCGLFAGESTALATAGSTGGVRHALRRLPFRVGRVSAAPGTGGPRQTGPIPRCWICRLMSPVGWGSLA